MKTFSASYLRYVVETILVGCRAPADEAELVARELVDASLMGYESHGVTRCIWYAEEALAGKIKPGAPVRIVKETATTAVVDCGFNFGSVGATRMAAVAAEKARASDIACILSQNGHHVARLAPHVQQIAAQDLVGLAFANSSKIGHYVVPFGGRIGRLATNPIAYAVPTNGAPVVFDISTSMVAEGQLRVLRYEGKPVPSGRILDESGNPTTDPNEFYGGPGERPRGAILPFGGEMGYKGFGLALLVEIVAGVLGGCSTCVDHPYINGLCVIAINPNAFSGTAIFKSLMDELVRYIQETPSAPGHEQVTVPGQRSLRNLERRQAEGIPLSEDTWDKILTVARQAGTSLRPAESFV